MRRPCIIFKKQRDAKSNHRLTAAFHLKDTVDEKRIVSLRWFVCGSNEGMSMLIRDCALTDRKKTLILECGYLRRVDPGQSMHLPLLKNPANGPQRKRT